MPSLASRVYDLPHGYIASAWYGADYDFMLGDIRSRARHDRQFFAEHFLSDHVTVPFGSHHKEWLSRPESRGQLEAIAAPRGSAKTTVFSLIDVLHAICYETEDFIVIISETVSIAKERVIDIKWEIENNDEIRSVFGDLTGSTLWQQGDIRCANGVRVVAKGRMGQIRGSKTGSDRPSLIILDDVESSEGAMNPDLRPKVQHWYNTDVRRAGRIDGSTNFRIVGTYLHQNSLLPSLVENPAYASKKYRAVLEWDKAPELWEKWREIYTDLTNENRKADARRYFEEHEERMLAGVEMLWPDGLSYYTVQEAIVSDGLHAVMKEYQNEPQDPSLQIFNMEKAQRFSVEREGIQRDDGRLVRWDDILGASLFLDWSGGKDTLDNAWACAVTILWEKGISSQEQYAYLFDVWLGRVGLSKQVAACFDLYDKHSRFHHQFAVEGFVDLVKGSREGVLHEAVQTAFYDEKRKRESEGKPSDLALNFLPRTRNKLERIAKLEPKIANGWLLFNRALPRDFLEMFEQFPTHQFLDGPDATEGALNLKWTRPRESGRERSQRPQQRIQVRL